MNEHKERCPTCRFWSAAEGDEYGECRVHAPAIPHFPQQMHLAMDNDQDEAAARVFPLTLQDDWCGEYQPQPPA